MATKVKVVTAYVDLGLTKRPSDEFHSLGRQLVAACDGRARVYDDFPFDCCWVQREYRGLPPANPRAEDRFATAEEHRRSNIVQHSPGQWVMSAYLADHAAYTPADVYVWMGYSLMKQGAFTGKPISSQHVHDFLTRLEQWTPDCIPFPGITNASPVLPFGDNWRFCGSVIIYPTYWLARMWHSYQVCAREFFRRYGAIPLDLAIWPTVEATSGLPFRFYQAEYDATQLTAFPA